MSQRPKEVRNTSAKNANNEEAKQITCAGKVVDARGRPIAGAKVKLYRVTFKPETVLHDAKLAQELTTKEDGAFTFKTKIDSDVFSYMAIILAEKEELALGWANWRLHENLDVDITLGLPKVLSGTVVDEAQESIADAEVGIAYMIIHTPGKPRYLLGDLPLELLTVRTDTEGKFSFDRIPGDASVEFLVKKPGRAAVSTFNPKNCRCESLQFSPEQTDIKLIQPIEAKIEGMVVEKANGKPVAGIQIMVKKGHNQLNFGLKPVISKEDGTFSVNALAPGKHILQTVTPIEGPADWVAEPVEVITEAGKTKSEVKVELSKGGLLEVVVTEAKSKKPVEKTSVSIRDEQTDRRLMGRSDKDGIALIRLMPGEYRIMCMNKQGLATMRRQQIITIEDGKTAHIEWQLTSLPKITGVVRDEKDKPIKGAKLIVCPIMGLRDVASDAEGKFEVIYDPDRWCSDKMPAMFLLGRYEKGNLAASVEIEKGTKTIEIKLKPALTFTGKVVDPDGKGITDARIVVSLLDIGCSLIGRDIARTDAQGSFEVKAIPPEHEYKVSASAEGYGGNRSEVIDSNDAVNNHLNVGTITLAVANLSVSGVVVDTDDKPVADAKVSCYDENQPHYCMQTDAEGKFTFEKICAGKIQISASTRGKTRLSGLIETDGGSTDVKVVIRERLFTRFTDRAHKVIVLANQEAQRLNHEYVGTEHILFGLIMEGSGISATVLKNLDVDIKTLLPEVEKLLKSGSDMVAKGKLPQTPRARKVIEYAIEEARSFNHNNVGTEHILLGLLRENKSTAAQVFTNLGLKLEDVRQEVLNLLGVGDEREISGQKSTMSNTRKRRIDSIPNSEMIWAKCNDPNCKAEYQMGLKAYFKYIEEHAIPMAPTAPPLVCEKCRKQSGFRAEKCTNPDCGIVFFRGAVPKDFVDRCPDCKRSETEEKRKQSRRSR